jgi:hypothetical protein
MNRSIQVRSASPGGISSSSHQLEEITPEVQEIFDNYSWKTPGEGDAERLWDVATAMFRS